MVKTKKVSEKENDKNKKVSKKENDKNKKVSEKENEKNKKVIKKENEKETTKKAARYVTINYKEIFDDIFDETEGDIPYHDFVKKVIEKLKKDFAPVCRAPLSELKPLARLSARSIKKSKRSKISVWDHKKSRVFFANKIKESPPSLS